MYEIAHKVKCVYCEKIFDRDKEEFVKINRRYAHKECADRASGQVEQNVKDKDALFDYIDKIYGSSADYAVIQKQIKRFIDEYNYTYSGMLKTLIYFYEIKGNSVDKSYGGVGIIPYAYKKAHDYYYAIWLAQQKNSVKDIEMYVPRVKEIEIPVPERKIKQRKLFTFLDEEEEETDGK